MTAREDVKFLSRADNVKGEDPRFLGISPQLAEGLGGVRDVRDLSTEYEGQIAEARGRHVFVI